MPAALTSTRTWPGPGFGSGRSSILRTSGGPVSGMTSARMRRQGIRALRARSVSSAGLARGLRAGGGVAERASPRPWRSAPLRAPAAPRPRVSSASRRSRFSLRLGLLARRGRRPSRSASRRVLLGLGGLLLLLLAAAIGRGLLLLRGLGGLLALLLGLLTALLGGLLGLLLLGLGLAAQAQRALALAGGGPAARRVAAELAVAQDRARPRHGRSRRHGRRRASPARSRPDGRHRGPTSTGRRSAVRYRSAAVPLRAHLLALRIDRVGLPLRGALPRARAWRPRTRPRPPAGRRSPWPCCADCCRAGWRSASAWAFSSAASAWARRSASPVSASMRSSRSSAAISFLRRRRSASVSALRASRSASRLGLAGLGGFLRAPRTSASDCAC